MISIEKLKGLFKKQEERFISDFFTFLRFESIATDPAFTPQVNACAKWLKEYLEKIGLKVEKWQTSGAPSLFATDLRAGQKKETLLLYCHYDVQPVDPINLWKNPPFEPMLHNGSVYARGALDNKGQCFYTICAIKILLQELGQLPINLKFLIDGEEESGSLGLTQLLSKKQKELKADHILIIDAGLKKANQPVITLGARGMTSMTVTLTGSKIDLHSGYGGAVYNPNRALVELLAKLHNKDGSIAIAGFYDDVVKLSKQEKQELSFDFDQKEFESNFGTKVVKNKDISPMHAMSIHPTLEINGISGGYSGSGFKTVIPAKAMAKISCRLVLHQDPDKIAQLVKNYLIANTPKEIEITVDIHKGNGACFRTNTQSHLAKTMAKAYSDVFEKPCEHILLGGSIPVGANLAKTSGGDMILVGVGLADDQVHAPNEKFGLDRFEQGYLTICRAIERLEKK